MSTPTDPSSLPAPTGPAPTASTSASDAVAVAVAVAAAPGPRLPRVAIQFCTQCKWMLRAAYFAQELLSTFGPALGEVALQPATGGVFTVTIEAGAAAVGAGAAAAAAVQVLWDRKSEGGFPETKELKRRVRDVIEPGRDLGHVDRHSKGAATPATGAPPPPPTGKATGPVCEDCQ